MAIGAMRNSILSQARTRRRTRGRIRRDRGDDLRPQPPKGGSFTSPCPTARAHTHSLLFQQLQSSVMLFGITSARID